MSEYDEKKNQVRKLSSRATQLKMDLHGLAEDLPINWEKIPSVAEKAFEAYKALEVARAELTKLGAEATGSKVHMS